MESVFWHNRWKNQQIGFHQPNTHELLRKHFSGVVKPGKKVFVPLCGKSNDMLWLLEKGYRVFGVELSELAVQRFFEDNQLIPEVTQHGDFKEYALDELALWVGDFFKLAKSDLTDVDAWYDRAAMVALPPEMRSRYVQQLCEQLPDQAKGLLITMEYPVGHREGPPFSVLQGEVEAGFGQRFSIEQLDSIETNGNNKHTEDSLLTEQLYKMD
ncbi:MAG: thiopurine S-methyltransferase [Pseudomonadota bacterium]